MKGFDPCLSKVEWCSVTFINEQIGMLNQVRVLKETFEVVRLIPLHE